jgi:type-F conjugative transfer system pilin assembly protein TrbC
MLRLVMLFLIIVGAVNAKEAYQEPSVKQIQEQNQNIQQSMASADKTLADGQVSAILDVERQKMMSVKPDSRDLIKMPDFLEKERTDRFMAKAIAAGKQIENSDHQMSEDQRFPIVLISLSMPKEQIKALIEEADNVGAAVAIKGFINNDYILTVKQLREIAGEAKAGGVLIDPTLFTRFNVQSVPAFILPVEPIKPCDDSGCSTPKNIKAVGSASLRYFLELIERTGTTEEKLQATKWLSKYKAG